MSEEDVDFVGSPIHAYFKELGLSDADTGCQQRERATKTPKPKKPLFLGQLSTEQRDIIECVLRDGADLLIEEDDTLLINLRREVEKSQTATITVFQRVAKGLKSAGFSVRHQVGLAFCLISVFCTVSVNFPLQAAFAIALIALLFITYFMIILSRRWSYSRERRLLVELMDALRTYIRTSRKAILLIQETNLLAKGYLFPIGTAPPASAQLDDDRERSQQDNLLFCASLNACLTRNTLQLVRFVSNCSRDLISASHHLKSIDILQDCLAQTEFEFDLNELISTTQPSSSNDQNPVSVGLLTISGLKRLHTSLVAHSSEYFRLVALAHSRNDSSTMRLSSAGETSQFAGIHKRLLGCCNDTASTVQACYYVNLYAFDSENDTDTDSVKGKDAKRTRQVGEKRSQLAEYAHAAFIHTRCALIECSKLETVVDRSASSTSTNVGDLASGAKEALESLAAALERACECVSLARTAFTGPCSQQTQQGSSEMVKPRDDGAHGDEETATNVTGASPDVGPSDIFLEADLRREAANKYDGEDVIPQRDAFAQRQRALADTMLREIRPALQVRAADFRERERRFKKERRGTENQPADATDNAESSSGEEAEAEETEVSSENDGRGLSAGDAMQLRRRKPQVEEDSDDSLMEEIEADRAALRVPSQFPNASGSASSNFLAQLVAQRAQTNRRRREETFELEADTDTDDDPA